MDNADATKIAQFQASGITTGNTRTYTLPDITDTLAALTATQTFTNKSVVDATFSIVDDADATKIAKFQASAITTATTRTYTLPDISDTLVTLTATQTLTNKTLTTPVLTAATGTTLSLSGTLTLANNTAFQLTDSGSAARRAFLLSSANAYLLGDIDNIGYNVTIRGKSALEFDINNSAVLALASTGATVTGIVNATGGFQFNGTAFPITQSATDTDRTITQAGTFTFTHGLSGAPKLIQAFLVCQTGELNYTAGQVVAISYGAFGTATTGLSLINGATTIVARYGNTAPVFALPDATTGTISATTNANWKLRLVAYA